jgi:hypothetical protein
MNIPNREGSSIMKEANISEYLAIPIWRIVYKLIQSIMVVVISSLVFISFILSPGINGYYEALFEDMIYGTAYKPFTYRCLLPGIVRFFAMLVPTNVRLAVVNANFHFLDWEPDLLPEYIIASILMVASLIGFYYAMKYLLQGIFHTSPVTVDVISLVALGCLPVFFEYYSYIYDFPTLFLFTLGLGLLVRRKWKAYLIVFTLACFNKETIILLTGIYAIYFYSRRALISKKQYLLLLFGQLMIFILSREYIIWIFRNNPGSSHEFHLIDHNAKLIFTQFTLANLMIILGLILLVFYKWAEKPAFLKNGLIILVPLLGATLLWGFLDELRDYYEVYPILVGLVAQTFTSILNIKMDPLPPIKISEAE